MSHLWSFPLFFNCSSFNYFKIFIMEIFQGYNERENSIPHPHTYHLSSTINFLVFLFSLFSPTFYCCCFVCVKYLKENHRHSILSVVFQYVFLTNKNFFHTIVSSHPTKLIIYWYPLILLCVLLNFSPKCLFMVGWFELGFKQGPYITFG